MKEQGAYTCKNLTIKYKNIPRGNSLTKMPSKKIEAHIPRNHSY